MYLRRIREHIAAQNWFAVAIELFIVVLGVFFGMQVNNWNQDRLDREQGRAYYARIADDLGTDIHAWQTSIAYQLSVQTHAKAALAALQQPRAHLGQQFLIDAYQATQIAPRPVTRGAYDEAVSRGVFNQVADVRMRDRITNYYVLGDGLGAIFGAIAPFRERLRRQMPWAASAAIIAHCSDIFTPDEHGAVMVALPETCDPGLTSAQVADAVAQIRAAPDIALDLNRQINDLEQKLTSLRLIMTTAQTLRRDMEASRR
jgi:hypothetical protein